jgi:hypothetical protein
MLKACRFALRGMRCADCRRRAAARRRCSHRRPILRCCCRAATACASRTDRTAWRDVRRPRSFRALARAYPGEQGTRANQINRERFRFRRNGTCSNRRESGCGAGVPRQARQKRRAILGAGTTPSVTVAVPASVGKLRAGGTRPSAHGSWVTLATNDGATPVRDRRVAKAAWLNVGLNQYGPVTTSEVLVARAHSPFAAECPGPPKRGQPPGSGCRPSRSGSGWWRRAPWSSHR